MDNKIIPIRPGVPLGRPEPQLPQLTPRDLHLARVERAKVRQQRLHRQQRVPTWLAFGAGALTARFIELLMQALS